MLRNNPSILITAAVDDRLLKSIAAKGIAVDVLPFIRTEIIRTKELQAQMETVLQQNATVVFTSVNAVEAVGEYSPAKNPQWEIYCTGNATRLAAEKIFGKESIAATGNDAGSLAAIIISNRPPPGHVYFFCGDKRRDELPHLLRHNNILVNEIEVYATIILPHSIEKEYDAVLFFSPTAAQGFFENNSVNDKTVLFAIGNTTASELRKYSKNEIVTADAPGKKNLVEKVIEYFLTGGSL